MQNFFSAAAGIAVAIAVIRGFARHRRRRSATSGWISTRATVYVLLPISIVGALLLCSQGVIQNLQPYTKVTTRRRRRSRPSRRGRWRRRKPSRCSAPTAADSSTPTRRIRSRIRRRSPTSSQMLLIFVIPGGPDVHVRQDGAGYAAGLGDLRRHDRPVPGRRVRRLPLRSRPAIRSSRSWDPDSATAASRRQHGRQGSALRHRQLRALRHRHHRRQLRRRQQHARQPHADRRAGPAVQHRDWAKSSSAASARACTACCCSPSWRCSSPA